MTIYELIYKANENDGNASHPVGLYSSFENAKTAGEDKEIDNYVAITVDNYDDDSTWEELETL